jgi:hypothetical protein
MRLCDDHAAMPVTCEAKLVVTIDIQMRGLQLHGHCEHFVDHGFHNPLPLRVEANHWNGAFSPTWLKVTCNPPTRAPRRHRRSDRRYPNSSLTRHHPRHCCACVFERCAGARGSSRRPFRRDRIVPRGGVERVRFAVDRHLGDKAPKKNQIIDHSMWPGHRGLTVALGASFIIPSCSPRPAERGIDSVLR